MPIFSRRSLQRMIHANGSVVGIDACRQHAALIDEHSYQSLAAEWEVAIIYALASCGRVAYEVASPQGRRADVCFYLPGGHTSAFFAAEIFCATNKGTDDDNPTQALYRVVDRAAKKAHLRPECFGLWINGGAVGVGRKQKMRAFVPRGARQLDLADEYVRAFVSLLLPEPAAQRSARIAFEDVDFNIAYAPDAVGRSGGGVNIETPVSVTQNSLYGGLKAKAKQLKQANPPGLRGVVVGDGGSSALESSDFSNSRSWPNQIVDEFLRVHTSIDFVVIFFVDRVGRTFDDLMGELAIQPVIYARSSMASVQFDRLQQIWMDVVERLPQPVNDARNAFHLCHTHRQRQFRALSHFGGWTVTARSIKVSAIEVLRLLAGEISAEEFRTRNRLFIDSKAPIQSNPFMRALRQGRTIQSVEVEGASDFDDDWLRFELSDPNPALANLTAAPPQQV